ncbi:hypothetical protein AB0J77_28065 [Micromonospora tulbaghiae]|uniref:hypothetical protein n=1 Tax=Micromonospora tulbaghiae TaxID=479978 RepID=UPI003417C22E
MNQRPQQGFPQDIKAIALDANCMPRGSLVVAMAEELVGVIQDQELEIEVWIPEPVLWEWAEHIVAGFQRTKKPYDKAVRAARAAGHEVPLPSWDDDYENIEVVLSNLTSALEWAECQIIRLEDYPQVAITAIRDQVLQLGPGRRKAEAPDVRVKTGASDSASFRLIAAHAGSDLSRVVLVSADKDVRLHFGSGSSPIVAKDIWQAKKALLSLMNGSQVLLAELTSAIEEQLVRKEAVDLTRASVEQQGSAIANSGWDSDRYLDTKLSIEAITEIRSIAEVESSRTADYATAEVNVLLDAQLEGVWWDDRDDELVHEWSSLYGVNAIAQVFAEKDVNGNWDIEVDHIVMFDSE